ncbi:MAG: PHP domain-containing protein [Deltaproteobacteria bacterium]|nr:PHP domain-containing protein [Deltaproteobacteria bacterium]
MSQSNLRLIVVDDETDQPVPARVELNDRAGKARPLTFSNDVVGVPLGRDAVGQLGSICLLTGDGDAKITPGRYGLTIQRGIEYDIVQTQAQVEATGQTSVQVRLPRAFQTPGWVGADFHVHSLPSPDSLVPAQDRAISMVIEGIEVVVASDHNKNFDLAEAVADLGLGPWLFALPGNEMSLNLGHWNVFPVPYDSSLPRGGGPDVNLDWDLTTALSTFRAPSGDEVLQLNHPRLLPPLGYFHAVGWNPDDGSVARPPFILDYDAIELLNGIESKREDIEQILRDWLGLMERGHVLTATGNSDTHRIASAKSGSPRTYLRVPDDRPDMLTLDAIRDAIRGRHVVATSGPWLDVRVNQSAGPGDTAIVPAGADVRLTIEIHAANFVPVDRIRVFANGNNLIATRTIQASINHLRFSETIVLPQPVADTFYVVVADAGTPLPRELAGRLDRDTFSYAIANPIFVDIDGLGFRFPRPRLSSSLTTGRAQWSTAAMRDRGPGPAEIYPGEEPAADPTVEGH